MAQLHYHESVIGFLESLAVLDQRLGPHQLVKMWYSDLYFPGHRIPDVFSQEVWDKLLKAWRECFTEEELSVLAEFHGAYEVEVDSLSSEWAEYRQDPGWLRVAAAARRALAKLGREIPAHPMLTFSRLEERDAVFGWAYVSKENRCIKNSWNGLLRERKEKPTPWDRFAVIANNEEVLVYMGIARALCAERRTLGITRWWSEEAAASLGKSGNVAYWEYCCEAEHDSGDLDEQGICAARSSVQISPRPTREQRAMTNRTRVFDVASVSDLTELLRAASLGARGEVNLFASPSDKVSALRVALTSPKKPTLSALLGQNGILVVLGIGVDLGYSDFVLVRSKIDLTDTLQSLASRYQRAAESYERHISSVTDGPTALWAMQRLLDGQTQDAAA